METWIKFLPTHEISDLGRIRGIKRCKILKSTLLNGYERIKIDSLGKQYTFAVHRLLLKTFRPTADETLVVNHIDGNSANNKLENLEWCTHKQNIHHSRRVTRNGSVISVKKMNRLFITHGHLPTAAFIEVLKNNSF